MTQPEATAAARMHPAVIEVQRRLDECIRELGHDPDDPRWVLADEAAAANPEFQRLEREHAEVFQRIRGAYMEGGRA